MFDYEEELDGYLEKIQELLKTKQYAAVRDLKSGKLLYAKDLVERDEAVVWGPIPIFSPSGSDRTSEMTMKHICLSALTDKAVAEAVGFLSGR